MSHQLLQGKKELFLAHSIANPSPGKQQKVYMHKAEKSF